MLMCYFSCIHIEFQHWYQSHTFSSIVFVTIVFPQINFFFADFFSWHSGLDSTCLTKRSSWCGALPMLHYILPSKPKVALPSFFCMPKVFRIVAFMTLRHNKLSFQVTVVKFTWGKIFFDNDVHRSHRWNVLGDDYSSIIVEVIGDKFSAATTW